MIKKVDVAVLGAGSASLFALREIKKVTNNFVLIDPGPLGTTCARVGCMPSKLLVQAANDFHNRMKLERQGIRGGERLTVDRQKLLKYVRGQRDHFVGFLIKIIEENKDHLISERAEFISSNVLKIGSNEIQAQKIIIATGSRPKVLPEWKQFGDQIFTSNELFELNDFPDRMAVLGLGAVGSELGQAMSRLGIEVTAFNMDSKLSGLTDPVIQQQASEIFSSEFSVMVGTPPSIEKHQNTLQLRTENKVISVDAILASIGRIPNVDNIGLENTGAQLDKKGIPFFDPTTMQLKGLPIFIAGDVAGSLAVLPEAADEGRIAGYNSVREVQCFQRRIKMSIAFTSPQIAMVGMSFEELKNHDFATGEVNFKDQGRSVIMQENKGMLRVYGRSEDGLLLGAELIAPDGEHLAHILALAIHGKMTVFDLLLMPFYHPVVEQGLRTALRELAGKVKTKTSSLELVMCGEELDSFA